MDEEPPGTPQVESGRRRRDAIVLALLAIVVLASPVLAALLLWGLLKLFFAIPGMRDWERDESQR